MSFFLQVVHVHQRLAAEFGEVRWLRIPFRKRVAGLRKAADASGATAAAKARAAGRGSAALESAVQRSPPPPAGKAEEVANESISFTSTGKG